LRDDHVSTMVFTGGDPRFGRLAEHPHFGAERRWVGKTAGGASKLSSASVEQGDEEPLHSVRDLGHRRLRS
jgi:hypothetical protein